MSVFLDSPVQPSLQWMQYGTQKGQNTTGTVDCMIVEGFSHFWQLRPYIQGKFCLLYLSNLGDQIMITQIIMRWVRGNNAYALWKQGFFYFQNYIPIVWEGLAYTWYSRKSTTAGISNGAQSQNIAGISNECRLHDGSYPRNPRTSKCMLLSRYTIFLQTNRNQWHKKWISNSIVWTAPDVYCE